MSVVGGASRCHADEALVIVTTWRDADEETWQL
jgi:hypothetical protein